MRLWSLSETGLPVLQLPPGPEVTVAPRPTGCPVLD